MLGVGAAVLDPLLERRLAEAGLDPAGFGDAGEAWRRLHDRFGRRVTLVDRYALEAAQRGVRPEALARDERARLAREVLSVQYPGLEYAVGSGRTVADRIEVVPYRDEWAASFAAWRDALQQALAEGATRIEHVGSTAVPGLPAKPIVDVQVSVRNVEEEDAYVPAIESLGVPLRMREPEHRYFRPAGDQRRDVQIHVCTAGGDWEREHLLFRDYLRADPAARAAYARLKRQLAERFADDRLAYNEGKTGFILDALSDAQAWAERTGWGRA